MYESLLNLPAGPFAEFERLQRELQQVFGNVGRPGSIRAVASGAFPAINVGSTPEAVIIYAFAPGIDPAKLDVQVDRGVLTISGERASARPEGSEALSVYANERHTGRFRRTVSLSDDTDPSRVEAVYRDGVLRISVARRASMLPRRIQIQ
ncbi:MAG: Hsp20/alpha crystallin family protein [Rhodocyclales bacterium]|nr:Hsp20/alpha crystallin family protein [Rhodocyclales bacterium]